MDKDNNINQMFRESVLTHAMVFTGINRYEKESIVLDFWDAMESLAKK